MGRAMKCFVHGWNMGRTMRAKKRRKITQLCVRNDVRGYCVVRAEPGRKITQLCVRNDVRGYCVVRAEPGRVFELRCTVLVTRFTVNRYILSSPPSWCDGLIRMRGGGTEGKICVPHSLRRGMPSAEKIEWSFCGACIVSVYLQKTWLA